MKTAIKTAITLSATALLLGCSIQQPQDLNNDGYGDSLPPPTQNASYPSMLGSIFGGQDTESPAKAVDVTSAPQPNLDTRPSSAQRDDSGYPNAEDHDFDEATNAFKQSPSSKAFFDHAYGYAIFPMIGKVGFVVGGAYGKGRVYKRLKDGNFNLMGDSEMFQGSIGFQLGGQAFSQIIFFQDKRAYDEFTSGNFEFGAQASAVVITAGASAEGSTKGTSASANLSKSFVYNEGYYYKGMAAFSLVTAGLMYEAALSGQQYTYQSHYPDQAPE